MKRFIFVCCLLAAALSLHARAIREETALSKEKSRMSYAFGMIVGSELSESGLEIDYRAFTDGLKAAMEDGTMEITREEAIELVETAFLTAQKKQNEEQKIKEMLFLTENGERAEVITTDSGLQYEVITEGKGDKPGESDTVQVLYKGMLLDGTVFDSVDDPDDPAEFQLGMVIRGWSEGVQLMNVGSKYRLYIPSALAYGERGAGQVIPPYSTLIFTVELLDIIKPNAGLFEDESASEAGL